MSPVEQSSQEFCKDHTGSRKDVTSWQASWAAVGTHTPDACSDFVSPVLPSSSESHLLTNQRHESVFSIRLGSIQGEAPIPKPRTDRPRRVAAPEEQRAMPAQVCLPSHLLFQGACNCVSAEPSSLSAGDWSQVWSLQPPSSARPKDPSAGN